MIEHDKNFYSLEELKRTIKVFEGCPDNEEVYYFIGSLRYANDEIERLNNIINELEEKIKELQEDIDVLTSDDDNDSVWLEELNK